MEQRTFITKFDVSGFFENPPREFTIDYNVTRLIGTLQEHVCTFMIISR